MRGQQRRAYSRYEVYSDIPAWEPVEDRLPTANSVVLVYYEHGKISMGYFIYMGPHVSFVDLVLDNRIYGRVTHWMPLPEKPAAQQVNSYERRLI